MSFDLPDLPKGWEYVPLDQLAHKNSVTYGVVQPGTGLSEGVPIVRVNNFKDGRIELADLMQIAPEIEAKYRRTRLQGGEVLLTLVGSVGQVAVASKALSGFNVARAVAVIHPAQDIEPEWIALCLRSPLSQHLLTSRANTTVQTTINLKDLRALPIPVPPVPERKKIAVVMGALDDRIALLRESSATLEAIAQALFKSWFVDLDPVRAKAEGLEPEGMDAATAALFPDRLEESELGLVPMGWRVGQLGNELRIAYGKNLPATKLLDVGFPVFGGNGQIGFFSEYLYESRQVLVSCRGAASGKVNQSPPKAFVTNNSLILETNKKLQFSYLKWFMKNSDLIPYVTGSAQPQVTIDNLKNFKILVPSENIVTCFESFVGLIEDQIEHNACQAKTLTQLRDTLLPRLISGQLRLPEAEVMLEEVCA
jgi:type I restriction enzyme S subunit